MPRKLDEPVESKPAYFWWVLANLLAFCFAILSWVFSLEVFGHPERQRNYEILAKIGRAPEIKLFNAPQLPAGDGLVPEKLYGKFFGLDERALDQVNAGMLHNYFTRLRDSFEVHYIEGAFQVREVSKIGKDGFFPDGVVVRARALSTSDDGSKAAPYPVVLECLLPGVSMSDVKGVRAGQKLILNRKTHGVLVLGVAKATDHDEPILVLRATPVLQEVVKFGDSDFRLVPPARVNLNKLFEEFRP